MKFCTIFSIVTQGPSVSKNWWARDHEYVSVGGVTLSHSTRLWSEIIIVSTALHQVRLRSRVLTAKSACFTKNICFKSIYDTIT